MRNTLYILSIIAISAQLYAAECTISTKGLTEGKEGTITIQMATGITPNRVDIIYSPNSQTTHTQTLPFSPSLSVIPHKPGIAKIAVFDGDNKEICSQLTSIHFHGIPWSGVIIFLLAAITLFTGTFISLKKALASD